MVDTFQECAKKEGFEIYFIKREHKEKPGVDPCIDASFDFPPFNMSHKMDSWRNHLGESIMRRIFHKTKFNRIFSYPKYVEEQMTFPIDRGYKMFPCIMPSWDNSCRRVNQPFTILKDSTPELFEKWAEYIFSLYRSYSKDENFVFINAWNEWAEGNHMEPDCKWGRGYLEALKRVVDKYNR